MKTLIRGLFLALTLVITSVAQAQDDNNPWVISFGVNAVDSYPTNAPTNQFGGETGNWFNEFYNTSHWNISPISTILKKDKKAMKKPIIKKLNFTFVFVMNKPYLLVYLKISRIDLFIYML